MRSRPPFGAAGGELPQAREDRPGLLRALREGRHRHEAAHTDALERREALEEAVERLRRDAVLAGIVRDVDLDQNVLRRLGPPLELSRRRVRLQRVDERNPADDITRLPALEVTDEIPRKELARDGLLRKQRIDLVLADAPDPGRMQHRQVAGGQVLDRREDLDRRRIAPRSPGRVGHDPTGGGDPAGGDLEVEGHSAHS